jgi:hypothetical protein
MPLAVVRRIRDVVGICSLIVTGSPLSSDAPLRGL